MVRYLLLLGQDLTGAPSIAVPLLSRLIAILHFIYILHGMRCIREASNVAIWKYLRRRRVLRRREQILYLFHAVFEIFCRLVEIFLAGLLARVVQLGRLEEGVVGG